jgi:hypothetical protein
VVRPGSSDPSNPRSRSSASRSHPRQRNAIRPNAGSDRLRRRNARSGSASPRAPVAPAGSSGTSGSASRRAPIAAAGCCGTTGFPARGAPVTAASGCGSPGAASGHHRRRSPRTQAAAMMPERAISIRSRVNHRAVHAPPDFSSLQSNSQKSIFLRANSLALLGGRTEAACRRERLWARSQRGDRQSHARCPGSIVEEHGGRGSKLDADRHSALRQTASGTIDVAEDHVRLEVVLPRLLAKVAQQIRRVVNAQGTMILEKK